MGDLGILLSGCSPVEQAARLRELRGWHWSIWARRR
jgi:hypothetical protein